MRLTQHTDYAFRVLMYLGASANKRVTIQQISGAYGISKNHLMKVVQRLVAAGYVASVRGQGGGLRLQLAPDEILLGEVARDLEPDMALVECLRADNHCVITPHCQLPGLLNQALDAFITELNRHSLEDLMNKKATRGVQQVLEI